ncbi:hypothetical protein PMZ80_005536 [Knufia obscura]|uniref:Uncharacterized protein n=1 Tax=Knufia obscura TaxID=1635080 RepID=A0ABR0RMY6_9EURO|nr:hypothetical protein PMZ80_005536 [Knufia obscura]
MATATAAVTTMGIIIDITIGTQVRKATLSHSRMGQVLLMLMTRMTICILVIIITIITVIPTILQDTAASPFIVTTTITTIHFLMVESITTVRIITTGITAILLTAQIALATHITVDKAVSSRTTAECTHIMSTTISVTMATLTMGTTTADTPSTADSTTSSRDSVEDMLITTKTHTTSTVDDLTITTTTMIIPPHVLMLSASNGTLGQRMSTLTAMLEFPAPVHLDDARQMSSTSCQELSKIHQDYPDRVDLALNGPRTSEVILLHR